MPNLVILPGLDGTGARFADFLREIAPAVHARVIPFPTDEPLGYAELETLVRKALPADRRFVLLAESFSGPLAIRIGADPPRGLAGVILCGTFATNPYPWLRPVIRHRIGEVLSVDETQRLVAIELPILVLTATRDRPPAARRDASAAAIAASRTIRGDRRTTANHDLPAFNRLLVVAKEPA